jgi:hypothetical protein
MKDELNSGQKNRAGGEKGSSTIRIIVIVLLAVVLLWGVGSILGFFANSPNIKTARRDKTIAHDMAFKKKIPVNKPAAEEKHIAKQETHESQPEVVEHAPEKVEPKKSDPPPETPEEEPKVKPLPPGIAFVQALIEPLEYELHERFWGWRPNDVFAFATDNVNNYQMGTIEVTRRTAEQLTENISRTGSTASFDKNLELARSTCFVIEAESWMFPSSEKKYKDGLKELEMYAEKLKRGEADFYTRADNLIPLLKEYEHLLGSCDNNLVKLREEDGSKVSFFMADNYVYYAKGVVGTMAHILTAIEKDFNKTLERRNCLEVMALAIESCEHAGHIDPWVVLNANYSGILANHRANMAAHISHARFYLEVLVRTLST